MVFKFEKIPAINKNGRKKFETVEDWFGRNRINMIIYCLSVGKLWRFRYK